MAPPAHRSGDAEVDARAIDVILPSPVASPGRRGPSRASPPPSLALRPSSRSGHALTCAFRLSPFVSLFAGPNFDFADDDGAPAKEKQSADSVQSGYIHIRTQQRNGRKSLTTVQGVNPKINKKVILKECKKKFNCNGTIVDDPELGDIIQLQGDQRKLVAQFLIDEKIAKKDVIKVHGS
jgi:translation initiation factor 1